MGPMAPVASDDIGITLNVNDGEHTIVVGRGATLLQVLRHDEFATRSEANRLRLVGGAGARPDL